jgi:hypothetical protein
MNGTRVLGLPCQHHLAMETDPNASPTRHTGGDHEALAGFEIHDVTNN